MKKKTYTISIDDECQAGSPKVFLDLRETGLKLTFDRDAGVTSLERTLYEEEATVLALLRGVTVTAKRSRKGKSS